jgi:acid phosphatase type 7
MSRKYGPKQVLLQVTRRLSAKLFIGMCSLLAILALCLRDPVIAQTQDVVLVGAADIGGCGPTPAHSQATAALLDAIPGKVFVAGDLGYPNGAETEFARCYDPTWGRHRSRTTPAPGIHDFIAPAAQGYFNYFGSIAGDPSKGYYSYGYGAWHVVIINDICSTNGVNGCTATSSEGQWLQSDLAANPTTCTVAIWHQPLYSSTASTVTSAMKPFWQILYNAGADLVINGHAHNYERFAPQDPSGNLDPAKGLREFVVGTGGESLQAFTAVAPNSEVRNSSTFGVLKLTLHATSYDWQFLPVAGQSFTDSGSQACH